MKNILLSLCFFGLFVSQTSHAQGFSKLIRYEADTVKRSEGIGALTYDSANNEIFFCLSSLSNVNFHNWSILYKADTAGNILSFKLDTMDNASNNFNVVIKSKQSDYLLWGGWAFDMNSDSTTMDYVLTKTDLNLNRIWRKRLKNPGIREAFIKSITEDKDKNITILCSKYTPAQDPFFPQVIPKIYLIKLDSMGNVLWERTPGQGYYDNAAALYQDEQNEYLIGGRTFSWGQHFSGAPFILKADADGNYGISYMH